MSDNNPHDPYAPPPIPPPESFESFRRPEPPPAADPYLAPEPFIAAEPVPNMAGAMSAAPEDARLPLDGATMGVSRVVEEVVAWLKTLASAAVYATLIVTFGFQVARVEGQSMAPTLADQDRLIVNKLAYRLGE